MVVTVVEVVDVVLVVVVLVVEVVGGNVVVVVSPGSVVVVVSPGNVVVVDGNVVDVVEEVVVEEVVVVLVVGGGAPQQTFPEGHESLTIFSGMHASAHVPPANSHAFSRAQPSMRKSSATILPALAELSFISMMQLLPETVQPGHEQSIAFNSFVNDT